MRGDWLVNGAFVELFGMAGMEAYDLKVEKKKRLAAKHGLVLISISLADAQNVMQLRTLLMASKKAA